MSSATAPMTAPIAPTSVADLNVRRTLVEDLFLKALFNIGEMSLRELGDYLCVKMSVMDELFNKLRKEQLCEVTGMTTGVHRIVSTTAGKNRAQTSLASSQTLDRSLFRSMITLNACTLKAFAIWIFVTRMLNAHSVIW
jgi:DNA-binding MarR family transcriptional regulator